MSLRSLLFIVVFFVFNGSVLTQSIETKLQSVLDSIYNANPTSIGIMAHVEASEKQLSWSGASGFADKAKNNSLDKNQPALIASNIKTYVSATILRLVEMKKHSIEDPIKNLLTDKTRKLFEMGGYNLEAIKIKHLLSHTSGIANYANQDYINFISDNPKHRWTRDAQLELTIKVGPPFSKPAEAYNYSDANYLLLTEIIENIYNKPFYTSMRELLDYESLGLTDTWIPTLEEKPKGTMDLVHQYWTQLKWDSHEIDVSVDLFGGGGIACTPADLAKFIHKLFNEKIIKDPAVFDLIYTEIKTNDSANSNYYLGLALYEYQNLTAYGHGGFWGTLVLYFPDLEASISVVVLERDQRQLRDDIINSIIPLLN